MFYVFIPSFLTESWLGNAVVGSALNLSCKINISFGPVSALGSTLPPIHWIPRAHYRGVKLITNLHLVPRFRIGGFIPLRPLCFRGVQRGNFTLSVQFVSSKSATWN